MHDPGAPSGGAGAEVLFPTEVDVPWGDLDASASGLKSACSDVEASMNDVRNTWGGLESAYQQPESQETVHSAMDSVPDSVQDWADTMDSAGSALQDFVTEGRPLQTTSQELMTQATMLQGRLLLSRIDFLGIISEDETDEDSQLRQDIAQHNQAVWQFNQDWRNLTTRITGRLESLHGSAGVDDDIPDVSTEGSGTPPFVQASTGSSFDGDLFTFMANQGDGDGYDQDAVDEAMDLYNETLDEETGAAAQEAFYDHLATMTPEEIEEFASEGIRIHVESPQMPRSQEELDNWPDGADWWHNALDEDQQDAMVEHLPLLTGNTEGVPYTERDIANTAALSYLLTSHTMTDKQKEALRDIRDSKQGDGRMLLSLNTYDSRRSEDNPDPLAAVSVGNPDEADTTSVNVPGMDSGTHNTNAEVDRADDMQGELGDDHAVVSWLGYEAPQWSDETIGKGDVLSDQHADVGGWHLAHTINGFNNTAEGQGRDPELRINAHSYGTNTAAHALTRIPEGNAVDSLTMFGSAGIPEDVAETAYDLEVAQTAEGRPAVYATEASQDWYAQGGRLWGTGRNDPTKEDFGAYVFSSDGEGNVMGYPTTGHEQTLNGSGEFGYLDEDSQSFNSILRISQGEADTIDFSYEYSPDGPNWPW